MNLSLAQSMKVKLPQTQQLMGYYHNVLRDWSYGDEENQLSLELIKKTLASNLNLGKTLILGAGAGRLSYDIYQQIENEFTLAIDINPYLLLTAQKILEGKQ